MTINDKTDKRTDGQLNKHTSRGTERQVGQHNDRQTDRERTNAEVCHFDECQLIFGIKLTLVVH